MLKVIPRGKKIKVLSKTQPIGRHLSQAQKTDVNAIAKRIVRRYDELKFKDVYDSTAAVQSSSLAAARGLLGVAQGVGDTQRVGDQLYLTSIQINLQLTVSSTQVMRLIIFKWKPLTTSYVPTLQDILNSPSNTAVGPVYMKRIDTAQEFTILYDKAWAFQVANVSNRIIRINLSKKLGKVQFDAGTTDGLHKIYYFLLTDVSAANTVSMYTRIRYKDM